MIAVGALAAASPWLSGTEPAAVAPVLCAAAVAITGRALWQHGLRRDGAAVRSLELDVRGHLRGERRDGRAWAGRLVDACPLGGWLLIRLRRAGSVRSESLLLTPAGCDPDALRRLRVALRWGRVAAGPRRRARDCGTSGADGRSAVQVQGSGRPGPGRPSARRDRA